MSPRRQFRSAVVPAVPLVDTTGCTFDRDKHLYTIDGVVIPSVTQVLEEERFVDFSMIPSETLEQAQARGTYVHQVLHAYLEEDFDLEDTDPRFRGYIDSALAFLTAAHLRPLRNEAGVPIAVEYRFWDRTRGVAGTIDYVAWDPDDVLTINDWKTGEPTDVAAALQTAAYEYGLRLTLFPDHKFPIRRRAVKLHRDGRPGRVEPYTDIRDLGMFFTALSCVHFRRNRLRYR
jgi:hypothetical protein